MWRLILPSLFFSSVLAITETISRGRVMSREILNFELKVPPEIKLLRFDLIVTSGDAELSVSLRWSRGSNHVISTKPGSDSVVYYNDYWAGLGFERVARIFVEGYSYASDYELTITYEVLILHRAYSNKPAPRDALPAENVHHARAKGD